MTIETERDLNEFKAIGRFEHTMVITKGQPILLTIAH